MPSYVILSGIPETCVYLNSKDDWSFFSPEGATRESFADAKRYTIVDAVRRHLRRIQARPNMLDRVAFAIDEELIYDSDGFFVGEQSLKMRQLTSRWRL